MALHDALSAMQEKRLLRAWPLRSQLGAVSVGIVKGEAVCDLNYHEDSRAEVDMNLVMTGDDELVEVQGAAEGATFSRAKLDQMLDLGMAGIREIQAAQRSVLEG